MRDSCEVCESYRPEAARRAGQKVIEVRFDARPVTLCAGHARIAQNSGVTTFEELRALYGSGRRSFVPRRRPIGDAPGAERRHSAGRRAADRA